MMASIREQLAKMTDSQLKDCLYTIELRCRQITDTPYHLVSYQKQQEWNLASDILTLIVSRRQENG